MLNPCRSWCNMGKSGWNKPTTMRGVTLIELLVTLVIMFILASVALPFTKVSAKRSQELELRLSAGLGPRRRYLVRAALH